MFLTLHDAHTRREIKVNMEQIAVVSADIDRDGTWLTVAGGEADTMDVRVSESYGIVVMLMGPNPHPFCEPNVSIEDDDDDEDFLYPDLV